MSQLGELSSQGTDADSDRKWQLTSKNNDTIHIEQTHASKTGNELKEYDDLVDLIEAKGQAQAAKNAGTTIEVTANALVNGNVISVDNGSGEVKKYMLTTDKDLITKGSGDTYTYVDMRKDAVKNLHTAIKADFGASVDDLDGNKITIRGNAEDDSVVVLGKGLTLQIGDTSDNWNQLNVAVQDCHVQSLGIKDLNISTAEAAQASIAKIKTAINTVSDVRGTLGATQNRLDHTINNLSVMTENIQDAESTIRDTDIAEEMMAYTKNNILIQASQAMLAQANQVPQGVLQLLQ